MIPISADDAMKVADAQSKGSAGTDDGGVLALFYTRPVYNKVKSAAEGRPMYDGKEYVQIIIPGDNKSVVDRPVQEADKQRWPEAWRKYAAQDEGSLDGTPLEEWSYLDVTRKASLRHLGIRTVEQLAAMPDGQLPQIGMDGRDVREWARQFLKPQSDRETELKTEVGELRRTVESLQASLAEAKRQIAEGPPDDPPRRRRKRNEDADEAT
ncbi:MAG: hypothetical protein ACR2PM_12565 [Hyphomicrobiales bacterium]